MFKSLFSKPTPEELLKVLRKESFDMTKADTILESIDINSVDTEGKSFLHHLCIENIGEPIEWLVKNGIDKELEDYYNNTALKFTIQYESTNAFTKLLESGVDVDKQNKNGRTVLQDSLSSNDLKFYHKIKKYTKNIDNIDKDGRNILFDAVEAGNKEIIQELISMDINSDLKDKNGKPVLLLDCVLNNFEILKLLIENDVDISSQDKEGNNLLYYMVKSESINVDIIDYAIENKININSVNKYGNTMLMEMINMLNEQNSEHTQEYEKNNAIIDIIDKLLECNIDINIKNSDGRTALMLCAMTNNDLILNKLILSDALVNEVDNDGNTALSLSIIKGNEYRDICKILVSNRANINIKDVKNQSVIDKLIDLILYKKNKKRIHNNLIATMDDNCDYLIILKDILKKTKIDLYSLNSHNEPYFFESILYGNTELTKTLIHLGFHINQLDSKGLNIIYKLMSEYKDMSNDAKNRYHESLKTVLGLRANVNTLDSFGGTTLHKAILDNDTQTVKMLINANADMDAKDKQGRNYLHNSIWKNRVQIMRVIHSKNVNLINRADDSGVLPINYAAFLGYTDLVVELISLGSVINNTNFIKSNILTFLKRFHKNIIPMFQGTKTSADQRNVAKLVENMRKEFKF